MPIFAADWALFTNEAVDRAPECTSYSAICITPLESASVVSIAVCETRDIPQNHA